MAAEVCNIARYNIMCVHAYCCVILQDFSKLTSLSDFRSSSLHTLVCPLIIWKYQQKMDYWCGVLLAGLPRHENAKFSNIHFLHVPIKLLAWNYLCLLLVTCFYLKIMESLSMMHF